MDYPEERVVVLSSTLCDDTYSRYNLQPRTNLLSHKSIKMLSPLIGLLGYRMTKPLRPAGSEIPDGKDQFCLHTNNLLTMAVASGIDELHATVERLNEVCLTMLRLLYVAFAWA